MLQWGYNNKELTIVNRKNKVLFIICMPRAYIEDSYEYTWKVSLIVNVVYKVSGLFNAIKELTGSFC